MRGKKQSDSTVPLRESMAFSCHESKNRTPTSDDDTLIGATWDLKPFTLDTGRKTIEV